MVEAWSRRVGAVLLIAAVMLAVACGSDDDDDGDDEFIDDPTAITDITPLAEFPVQFVRSDDVEVSIEQPVQRIVSLSPGATESLYAMGAGPQIVAVDNNADYPAEAQAFEPKVDAFQPNVEAIAALNPDLVIVASNVDGIVEALDRLGIPVLYTDLDTDMKGIEEVQGQIALLGRLTGRVEPAQQIIQDMQTRVKAVEDKLVGLSNTRGPSVYHELDSSFYSVAEDTFIGNLYRTLKARNIAGDGGGVAYPQLTQEAIIAANPDIIVLADEEFGVTIESVRARPGWNVIAAVENERIYGIDPDIISRPGPRIVDALEQLARNFYPETFQ